MCGDAIVNDGKKEHPKSINVTAANPINVTGKRPGRRGGRSRTSTPYLQRESQVLNTVTMCNRFTSIVAILIVAIAVGLPADDSEVIPEMEQIVHERTTPKAPCKGSLASVQAQSASKSAFSQDKSDELGRLHGEVSKLKESAHKWQEVNQKKKVPGLSHELRVKQARQEAEMASKEKALKSAPSPPPPPNTIHCDEAATWKKKEQQCVHQNAELKGKVHTMAEKLQKPSKWKEREQKEKSKTDAEKQLSSKMGAKFQAEKQKRETDHKTARKKGWALKAKELHAKHKTAKEMKASEKVYKAQGKKLFEASTEKAAKKANKKQAELQAKKHGWKKGAKEASAKKHGWKKGALSLKARNKALEADNKKLKAAMAKCKKSQGSLESKYKAAHSSDKKDRSMEAKAKKADQEIKQKKQALKNSNKKEMSSEEKAKQAGKKKTAKIRELKIKKASAEARTKEAESNHKKQNKFKSPPPPPPSPPPPPPPLPKPTPTPSPPPPPPPAPPASAHLKEIQEKVARAMHHGAQEEAKALSKRM